jgi:hypothetical protein
MHHARSPWLLLTLPGAALLSACHESPTELSGPATVATPIDLLVVPDRVELVAGASAWLQGQVNDTQGQVVGGAPIAFQADNPQLLKVTIHGEVTARGPAGQGTVRVVSGSLVRSVAVTVAPGPAERVLVERGAGLQTSAGVGFPAPVAVRLVDAFGNGIPGQPLALAVEGPSPTELSATTASDGRAAFDLPVLTTAGAVAVAIRAATPGAPLQEQLTVQVLPGEAAALQLLRSAAPPEGSAEARNVEVRVADRFGNPVSGAAVLWRIGRGGGSVNPQQGVSDGQGVVRCEWRPAAGSAHRGVLAARLQQSPGHELTIDFDALHERAQPASGLRP